MYSTDLSIPNPFENCVVSFNGSDGSGKTSIGSQLHEQLTDLGQASRQLRTLGYANWADAETGRTYDGWISALDASEDYPDDPLYIDGFGEFPARHLACNAVYGAIAGNFYRALGDHKAQNAGTVIIDSDPVIKGYVWARVENEGEAAAQEMNTWTTIMRASGFQPDFVIHVEPRHEDEPADTSILTILDRIRGRQDISSTDPQTLTSARRRLESAAHVGRFLEEAIGIDVINVYNPNVPPERLEQHLVILASQAITEISRRHSATVTTGSVSL